VLKYVVDHNSQAAMMGLHSFCLPSLSKGSATLHGEDEDSCCGLNFQQSTSYFYRIVKDNEIFAAQT